MSAGLGMQTGFWILNFPYLTGKLLYIKAQDNFDSKLVIKLLARMFFFFILKRTDELLCD